VRGLPTPSEIHFPEREQLGSVSEADDETASREEGTDRIEPTPQSEALRRQQLLVGVGGGVITGLAAAASTAQQFPDLPLVVPLTVGLLGAVGIFWLASRSIFPGADDAPDEQ